MPKGGNKHQPKHEAREDARQDRQDIKELFAELKAADEFYFADLNAINGSGVEGYAFITVERNGPGSADDVATVRMVAAGLQAGEHAQHIHGFDGTDQAGREAVTPTLAADSVARGGDGDGVIELLEGVPDYGPVLLNLRPFSTFTQDGSSLVFNNSFHLPGGDQEHNMQSHGGDTITTFDDLDLNHIVIHGMRIPGAVGEVQNGTFGEFGARTVNGVANPTFDATEYKEFLPVTVGEIEQVSLGRAHQFLKQAYAEGFDFIG